MTNQTILRIPNDAINNPKCSIFRDLLEFENNQTLKAFYYILQEASQNFLNNKTANGLINFKGMRSRNGFLFIKNHTIKEIGQLLKNIDKSAIFSTFEVLKDGVAYELSNEYIRGINPQNGFTSIDLMALKDCKHINKTKLKILTTLRPRGYFDLNFLIKVLNIKNGHRSSKIRTIKEAFKSLNINVRYSHPSNQNADILPEHFRFSYDIQKEAIIDESIRVPKIDNNFFDFLNNEENFNTETQEELEELEELEEYFDEDF